MGRNRLTKSFICLTEIADLATCNSRYKMLCFFLSFFCVWLLECFFVFCFCVFSHVCLNRFPIKE